MPAKKIFAVLGMLSCFSAISLAQSVFDDIQLYSYLSINEAGSLQISSNIAMSISFPSFLNKNFIIGSNLPVFISGASIHSGFQFFGSTVSFAGSNGFSLKNFVSIEGGAIRTDNSNLSSSGIYFSTNSAYSGGAVYTKFSTATVYSSSFVWNASSYAGGAFYAYDSNSKISDSVFNFNSATNFGGAVYIEKGVFSFSRVHFSSNAADIAGSAVYVLSSSGSFNSSTISNGLSNCAALYASSSAVSLYNVKLHSNEALTSGGAAFITDSIFLFWNSNAAGNKA
ncbi:MAG: hypothetical protein LBU09_04545, partial [Endomicrobium sp.]|nr:hypothetical protein [Endomicrobium sp.]